MHYLIIRDAKNRGHLGDAYLCANDATEIMHGASVMEYDGTAQEVAGELNFKMDEVEFLVVAISQAAYQRLLAKPTGVDRWIDDVPDDG